MHRSGANWPHFMEHHGNAVPRQLPGGLAAGKTAADDMNWPQSVHRSVELVRFAAAQQVKGIN
jgi:hypothetical protein